MLSVEKLVELLSDRKISVVCERTGLSYPTLLKFSHGELKRPQHRTVCELSDYFLNTSRAILGEVEPNG